MALLRNTGKHCEKYRNYIKTQENIALARIKWINKVGKEAKPIQRKVFGVKLNSPENIVTKG